MPLTSLPTREVPPMGDPSSVAEEDIMQEAKNKGLKKEGTRPRSIPSRKCKENKSKGSKMKNTTIVGTMQEQEKGAKKKDVWLVYAQQPPFKGACNPSLHHQCDSSRLTLMTRGPNVSFPNNHLSSHIH
ncbi:hypothetical protein GYH30_027532 [Glycine max]|nr:hypothetical protein GYH30_027532 [Glycine max]